MSIDPRITGVRDTPNKSPRQPVKRRGAVLHGAAMTSFDGLVRLAMGAKQVSADHVMKDRNNERLIPDGFRAWSLSSAYYDSAFRSVECCNESTNGYTISDESHWTLARTVAYWSEIDDWWPHRDGDPRTWTVIGHREVFSIYGDSYATSCPGGMDLDLVTRRAQQLRLEGDDDMGLSPREAQMLARIHDWITQAEPNLGREEDGEGYKLITQTHQRAGWAADATAVRDIEKGGTRQTDGNLAELIRETESGMTDAQVRALGEQLKKQGIVATLDEKTLAAVGQAARAAIVK